MKAFIQSNKKEKKRIKKKHYENKKEDEKLNKNKLIRRNEIGKTKLNSKSISQCFEKSIILFYFILLANNTMKVYNLRPSKNNQLKLEKISNLKLEFNKNNLYKEKQKIDKKNLNINEIRKIYNQRAKEKIKLKMEDPIERERILTKRREYMQTFKKRRSLLETEEQKEQRLIKEKKYRIKKKENETDEEYEKRLKIDLKPSTSQDLIRLLKKDQRNKIYKKKRNLAINYWISQGFSNSDALTQAKKTNYKINNFKKIKHITKESLVVTENKFFENKDIKLIQNSSNFVLKSNDKPISGKRESRATYQRERRAKIKNLNQLSNFIFSTFLNPKNVNNCLKSTIIENHYNNENIYNNESNFLYLVNSYDCNETFKEDNDEYINNIEDPMFFRDKKTSSFKLPVFINPFNTILECKKLKRKKKPKKRGRKPKTLINNILNNRFQSILSNDPIKLVNNVHISNKKLYSNNELDSFRITRNKKTVQ